MVAKFFFIFLGLNLIALDHAKAGVHLTPMIKKGDPGTEGLCFFQRKGESCKMSWKVAKQYCHDQNLLLPTIRELALYAQEHGAKVIEKTSIHHQYDNFVQTVDRIGEIDEFHFDGSGFTGSDCGRNSFCEIWSDSISKEEPGFAYMMNDNYIMYILSRKVFENFSVRCIDPKSIHRF